MSPSVHDNTKHRCNKCGGIADFDAVLTAPECLSCGAKDWDSLAVTPVCDFCSNVTAEGWTYPCEDFLMATVDDGGRGSKGEWFACQTCHELIEANDHDGLAQRAIDAHPDELMKTEPPWKVALMRAGVRELHDKFRENRTGSPYPETVEGE